MKKIATIFLLICVGFPLVSAQAADHKDKVKQLILQLEKEGREATLKNDLEANDRLLADDWINTNTNGTVTTKAQLMMLIKSGSFKILTIETEDVKVRVYTDCAVVTGLSTTKREGRNGDLVARQVRFTRVYARTGTRWQVVSAQSTPVNQ
jgi:ketosteroid isomerase-like protein